MTSRDPRGKTCIRGEHNSTEATAIQRKKMIVALDLGPVANVVGLLRVV
jgi:hypothetical protein